MDEERDEVYERIPWETLERTGSDRQWLVYALAGAVTLGALAYSFMRNQPTAAPPPEAVAATTVPATTTTSHMGTTSATASSPVVVAEADLFAVDPERLYDQAAAHAEWFAVEYMTVDGSEVSNRALAGLLPDGVPMPSAAAGTQVFVDWARTRSVTQTGAVSYDVEVVVRSLASTTDSGFVRQPAQVLTVPIEIGDDGLARVSGAPTLEVAVTGSPTDLALGEVPTEVLDRVELGDVEVVGGTQRPDGTWEVVVMAIGTDGVKRPVTVHP